MEKEYKEVDTIHEKDLDKLLKRFGMEEKFYEGKIKCKFCKNQLSKENLYSILPESGTINFICAQPTCISMLLEYLSEKRRKNSI